MAAGPPSEGFGRHILAVATTLIGEPRPGGTLRETRFGNGLTIDQTKGTWYSHSDNDGGGVLALIKRETGCHDHAAAVEWLKQHGYDVPDDGHRPAPNGYANGHDKRGTPVLVATWEYRDREGAVRYAVDRLEWPGVIDPKTGKPDKTYSQRKPDGNGGWIKRLGKPDETPRILYRLADIADARNATIFLVEGEKCVDALAAIDCIATTNVSGSGNWLDCYSDTLRGCNVVVLPDNDAPGRKHRDKVCASLLPVVRSLRVLELPGLPDKGDVVDWLAAGGTQAELFRLVNTKAREWQAPPYESKFGAVPWSDIWAPGQEYDWLIKGIIPEREAVLIFGAPQTGKSFETQNMCMAVARGLDYHGFRVRQAGCVYCAFEGGKGFIMRERAYALAHNLSADEPLDFVVLTRRADLFSNDVDIDNLIAEIKHWASTFRHALGLVTLDTWSAATPGAKENASEDVSRIRARVMRIVRECQCAVIVVHHKNAEGSKPRGHTSLTGDYETTIDIDWATLGDGKGIVQVKDVDGREVRVLTLKKQREGDVHGKTWKFVLARQEVGKDADGDPIFSCVVRDPAGGEVIDERDVRDPTKRVTADGRVILQDGVHMLMLGLANAIARHGRRPPGDDPRLLDVQAVTMSEWREAIERLTITDDDDDPSPKTLKERAKKARDRGNLRLMRNGLIVKDGIWVWRTGRRVNGIDPPAYRKAENETPEMAMLLDETSIDEVKP